MPGAWLVLPTYNEAENLEPMVRAALPQLASSGARAPRSWSWTTTRPTAPGRSPTAWPPSSTRSRCCTAPGKEGIGRAYLAGFARALAGGADLMLEMDCDFSHDPADLPRLIAAPPTTPTWCSARATCPAAA